MNMKNITTASASCPALFLAAPGSGSGKTTVTAALARAFTQQGKVVRVFKTGPDYLDPQILAQASGQPVEQLDMWMAGEAYCQQMLYQAAQDADLILVEGVMGLFDGEPSSADLAARFNIPLAIVMDVKGMAQTAAAIAMGLANFRDDIQVAGLIANSCGTERHAQLIRDALPESLPLLATLPRDPEVTLPERHLGLVQAEEVQEELEQRFNAGVSWLNNQPITELPAAVTFYAAETEQRCATEDCATETDQSVPDSVKSFQPLAGKTVAIARDRAFSFIYDANLRLLNELGAEYRFFSPLTDHILPEADALWLPGGYPELYARQLSENTAMLQTIQTFHQAGKPILAECGGFLYSLETLTDLEDNQYPLLGLLTGHGAMRGKRGCQGMQTAPLPEGEVRAHAHHRSRCFDTDEPIAHGRRQRHPAPGEGIWRNKGLTASYLHLFFPSNPEAIARIFGGDFEQSAASVPSASSSASAATPSAVC
ncbi:cobyrinate a,c-diamide synthase [Oceanospirillum beijerinckii]|uniref:cobyrinate a,c-diamide synthase n=1 Tax=Oceanospirillum beijerinckii TaxID=64976 RepID=UPI0004887FDE